MFLEKIAWLSDISKMFSNNCRVLSDLTLSFNETFET